MKNTVIVTALIATVGLAGCATQHDLSQMKANIDTASAGDFGRCMETLHAGAVELETARKVLREGEENDGRLTDARYEEGLEASTRAAGNRKEAEEACNARIAALEQRLQRVKEVLRGVTFEEGSATLTEDARVALDLLANRLLRAPARVEVSGHTSNTGSLEFNMTLSQQRADAVRDHLISQGVPADSITAKGYGPNEPIASNETPEGRRANQRVELEFLQ